MSEPPRRRHQCVCGWVGRRYAHAEEKPCPECGREVYLTARRRGEKEARDTVRRVVYLPRADDEALAEKGAVSPQIRAIVSDHVSRFRG